MALLNSLRKDAEVTELLPRPGEAARDLPSSWRPPPPAPPKGGRHRRKLSVAPPGRLVGLDGIRGLAALFVVLHHCWLAAFPGFPYADAPWWTAWLAFGH